MRPIEPLAEAFISGELTWIDLTVEEREAIHVIVMRREVERIAEARQREDVDAILHATRGRTLDGWRHLFGDICSK